MTTAANFLPVWIYSPHTDARHGVKVLFTFIVQRGRLQHQVQTSAAHAGFLLLQLLNYWARKTFQIGPSLKTIYNAFPLK